MSRFVHAKTQGVGFDTVLTAVAALVVGARLLHRLAIGVLSHGRANGEGENDHGDEEVSTEFHDGSIKSQKRRTHDSGSARPV